MKIHIIQLVYLIAIILFVKGLKGLSSPRSAVKGNGLSALGMLLAIVTILVTEVNLSWTWVFSGLFIGSVIGILLALKVQMTAMPQLVAIFNGLGGGASLFVAMVAVIRSAEITRYLSISHAQLILASFFSVVIGGVTLFGSMVAFLKLKGVIRRVIIFKRHQLINAFLFTLILLTGALLLNHPEQSNWVWGVVILSSLMGILLVIPIGGADMPVVIAALNAYSGLAAAATGFVFNSTVLIISGSLVGASGLILTRIMCKAMNRSFFHVITGKSMGGETTPFNEEVYEGKVKKSSAEEVAMVLEAASRVMIVPGYGMAVSQAQYAVRDLSLILEKMGIEVLFGIHPVAGRMPGHMNVLLAEADISYDKLKDLESANPLFESTDVSLIIGANDVVNPDARENTKSPISGMPVLNVDKSRTVVIIKRTLSPGFAGIPNPLFAADHSMMLFDDGKKGVEAINSALNDS